MENIINTRPAGRDVTNYDNFSTLQRMKYRKRKTKVIRKERQKRKYKRKSNNVRKEIEKAKSYVKNLADKKLSDEELLLLSKNLKFVPTPGPQKSEI